MVQREIERRREALIPIQPMTAELRVSPTRKNLGGIVGGAVVDNQQFPARERLSQQIFQCPVKETGLIKRWHEHRDADFRVAVYMRLLVQGCLRTRCYTPRLSQLPLPQYRNTFPCFITSTTCRTAVISSSGLPCTATRSASIPSASAPIFAPNPRDSAATDIPLVSASMALSPPSFTR